MRVSIHLTPRAIGVALGMTVFTVVVIAVPATRLALVSLPARIALEMLNLGAMATAGVLLAVLRRQQDRQDEDGPVGREAFVAALVVQGLANIAFGVVPAILGEPPTFDRTFYPWLTGRYAAGALFLAAAVQVRSGRLGVTVGSSVVAMAVVEGVVRAAQPQLPLPPDVAPGQIAPAGLHVLLEAVPLVLFAVGANVAARHFLEDGEPLDRWLSFALLVGVFTQVHQALFPAALGAVITSADLLRALSALLLLVGAVRQVVRLQEQRTTALRLLQEDLALNQELLAQVREAREREAAFTSVVTHELSSPLAAINAHVHLITLLADDGIQPYVTEVRTEAERLGALVGRMDELRAMEGEEFTVDLRPVAVLPLLEEVASFISGLPGGHDVQIDATGARVQADPVRLGQVLRNLASNATRYAPKGSTIRLLGHVEEGGRYALIVSDEGPGVAGEDVAELFNPYTRGRSGVATKGSGLGLHIARRIIEAHSGTISFVDVDDPGARVQIVLEQAR